MYARGAVRRLVARRTISLELVWRFRMGSRGPTSLSTYTSPVTPEGLPKKLGSEVVPTGVAPTREEIARKIRGKASMMCKVDKNAELSKWLLTQTAHLIYLAAG
jgi:hypothetical protein